MSDPDAPFERHHRLSCAFSLITLSPLTQSPSSWLVPQLRALPSGVSASAPSLFFFLLSKKKSDFQGHSVFFFLNYPTTSFTSQRYNRGCPPKFKLNILHARPSYMRYFDPTHPELIECRYTGLGALRFISSARMCPTSARKRILFSSLRTRVNRNKIHIRAVHNQSNTHNHHPA